MMCIAASSALAAPPEMPTSEATAWDSVSGPSTGVPVGAGLAAGLGLLLGGPLVDGLPLRHLRRGVPEALGRGPVVGGDEALVQGIGDPPVDERIGLGQLGQIAVLRALADGQLLVDLTHVSILP